MRIGKEKGNSFGILKVQQKDPKSNYICSYECVLLRQYVSLQSC